MTDLVSASVDVGTGNLMVSTQGLQLPGIGGGVGIGAAYNSFAGTSGSTSNLYANNWSYAFGGAGTLSSVTGGGVVFTAGDGGTWLFTPVTGSTTAFTAPAGLKASLVKTSSGYTLTQLQSQRVITFDADGKPLTVADRNANATTINYTAGAPSSVVSPAGPSGARTASLSYSSGSTTLTISQTSGSSTRSVEYVKDSSSNLTGFVDANGKTTAFAYVSGKLTKITSPTGAVTNISYDSSSAKVSQIDQLNTSAGSPGTSTTRLSYASATQTLVAGPNTSTGSSIAASPHVTYTIDSTQRVTGVTDEQNRQRGKTYTPNFDTATATSGTGTTAGTTTATYGANSGQSLTAVAGPGGATSQAAYTNSTPATQYLPSSTTDDAGNTSTYTYNGQGNPLTSAQGTPTATATLTYNTDGTVATAAAPGNGTNVTTYGYDTDHQLHTITPPTGTSLGVQTITYDDFGRVKTKSDGKGVTTTYGYDNNDRLLSTSFSDSTHSTVNTYDDAGKLKTAVDGNGTITNTYDQLERLTSTVNTAGGGTESYTYDKASNLITTTDGFGTTTNTYDTSNVLTSTKYPHNGSFQNLYYTTDDQGRRTDTYLQSDASKAFWQGHTHYTYDTSGRVTGVKAETGPAPTTVTVVLDVTYCYNAGSAAPTCATTAGSDRSKLQWSKDNLTGQTTTYTYDTSGRIQNVAQAGGSGANTYAYTYDARGNRLTATVTGATPSSQTLTFNAANQITTTGYSYDGAGNLTAAPNATYSYNGAQQMTSATTSGITSTYTYAGTSQNQVLSETFAGKTYNITYGRPDPSGQPTIEQYAVTTSTGTAQAYVLSDPKTGQPLMLSTSSDQNGLYVMDAIGNPVGMLTSFASNAFTFTYDPYGAANLTAGGTGGGYTQNPYLFKAGLQDRATGLVKFGQRWYNPTTGAWTQQDTLDAPLDPANGNRYAYAGGDPINGNDPSGKLTDTQQCGLAFAFVGTAESVGVGAIWGSAFTPGVGTAVGAAVGLGFGIWGALTC